jgi:hypothetical protein
MTYIAEEVFEVDNEVTLTGSPIHETVEKTYESHFLTMKVKVSDSGGVRFEYESENIHKSFSFTSRPQIIGAYEVDSWLEEVYEEYDLE